jgi:corrinoid protein of di/trimethylamine methyltransferase
MKEALYQDMARSIVEGEVEEAERLAMQAVQDGLDPLQAINEGFVKGLDVVGEEFGCGNLFLPDLVLAAEAMKAAIAILEPELARRGSARNVLGRVVIGTVDGDIHDIGKTLVATMLAANGFEVHDLGVSVRAEQFAAKAREVGADIVGLSALLTTTMVRQQDVIEALEDIGLRPQVRVMVGGAPVTAEWASKIGADGTSEDAIGAVALARRLVGVEG